MSQKEIDLSEHVVICGMTGSGKTYLAQVYLMNTPHDVFVLDTKGTFNWDLVPDDKKQVITTFDEFDNLNTNVSKYIYRPIWEELDEYYYNEFFKFCMQRKNCIILIDEGMQVSKSASSIIEWYKGALTRGRELNVSVWTLTQRPANIPIVVFSESTHYFIFKLNNIMDRKRLSDYTGYTEFLIPPDIKHSFLYFNTQLSFSPKLAILD